MTTTILGFILIYQLRWNDCFDYKSVNLWRNEFSQCGGNRQSPININLSCSRNFLSNALVLKDYDVFPAEMTVMNDGHSAKFEAKWTAGKVPSVSGGPLNASYLFDSFHFHWGQSNSRGSEHTFNGRQFALEMHLVHYKGSYGSFKNAANKSDGIAVIGVIFQVTSHECSELQPVVKNLTLVKEISKTVKICPFPLSIFQLSKGSFYITYQGSLTTPPCSQTVTWLLSKTLSRMEAFRQLDLENGDKENFRPIQPLHGRLHYYVQFCRIK